LDKERIVLRKCWVVAFVIALSWPPAASANRPKTYFDHLDRVWAVGELRTREPLRFRDGVILVFPAQFVDLTYGRLGKPRSVMLVEELSSAEAEPMVPRKDAFYAPINVLPQHSYWRDNLPQTPHHSVPGGRRYLFTGDDIGPVKNVTKAYTDTLAMEMPERRIRQQALLVDTLKSEVKVLREDALRRLEWLPVPEKFYDDATKQALAEFAAGEAPEKDRATAVGVIARAEMRSLIPQLEKLSESQDSAGGAALRALDHLGEEIPVDRLLALADSDAFEVQSFAVSKLGERAGDDPKAYAKVVEILESDESEEVRSAAGVGLGKSASAEAVAPLTKAVARGDLASRGAAAGLGELATPDAIAALKSAVESGPTEAQVGSILALAELTPEQCADCSRFLLEQHEKHSDEAVRDLISLVLQLPHKHEH
jgi:hypothetical protein